MTTSLRLDKELGIEETIVIDETSAVIRKVWVNEKENTLLYIKRMENHDTYQKFSDYTDFQCEYIDHLIEYVCDIIGYNLVDYYHYFVDNVSIFELTEAVSKLNNALLKIKNNSEPQTFDSDKEYRNELKKKYNYLDNSINDFDYNEQQVMTQLHISPKDYEEQNYYRLNEVLSAMSPEERPMTGAGFLGQLGLSKDQLNNAMQKNGEGDK